MKEEGILNKAGVKKLLRTASASANGIMATVREGSYVRLTPQTHPNLFAVLSDVCAILDCSVQPVIYLVRMEIPIVIPCGGQSTYLVISTSTLEQYDCDMLYYALGNAVAMIKAGHVDISQIMAYLPGGLLMAAPKVLLLRYVHAIDVSSDRGGLLACQSLSAALRCHFLELGIPPEESRRLFSSDAEAAAFLERYLAVQAKLERQKDSFFTKIAQTAQDMNSIEAPGNQVLRKLYEWYRDPEGYSKLLQKAKAGQL